MPSKRAIRCPGSSAPAPTDGSFLVVSDPTAPSTCSISQDVAIPAGATATLTGDVGYLFDGSFGNASGCSATVAVTTTGGAPITTLFENIGGTTALPLAAQPAVDLSAQAGSTVRILIEAVACGPAPIGILVDNVVLDATTGGGAGSGAQPIPVMPGWLLLMMAALLAALGLRRFDA